MNQNIRWHQRLENFDKALRELSEAVALSKQRSLSKLEEQGLIQAFEYNYELAWNVIKDFYESQGEYAIQGSRDAFRLAFKRGLIHEGQIWMDMIQYRSLTTHTYNHDIASKVVHCIIHTFLHEFCLLNKQLHHFKSTS